MVRYTIHDRDKTISFVGDAELAHFLTAACASEPPLLEYLLLATEVYRPGIVRQVMHALLEDDAALAADRPLPTPDIFEVRDERTRDVAATPDTEGLITIDLVDHDIATVGPLGDTLRTRGTVRTTAVGSHLERETVFALGSNWSINRASLAAAGAR